MVATEIPIGAEHDLRGVIDLIDMKAFLYEGEGPGSAVEEEIPEELREQAEEYREKLMDEVAENSDELMERYLEGEEIDHEEIVTALKRGVTAGTIFPVTCGAATRNLGTDRLLEALVEDLPSPAMRGSLQGLGAGEEAVEIEPEDDDELIAYVFKTLADPYAGRINLFRVFRGTIRSDSQVINAAAARRSGSASSGACSARACCRSTSSAPATSARSRSSRRPAPATSSATARTPSTSRRSSCPRR